MDAEFTRLIEVDHIPAKGQTVEMTATGDECALLAARFGILAVNKVEASFKVKPVGHGSDVITVKGLVRATIVQACVVTLTPLEQEVEESFELSFSPQNPEAESAGELDIDLTQDDPPEPIYDGNINLGEIAAQFLALGIDPFPRLEDAEFVTHSEGDDDTEAKPASPFAALARLK